jgi:hypothetical protein
MARGTERDQPVEVEVRAALGALDDVVDLEPGADSAGLAGPLGSGQHLRADFAPGLEGRRRAAEGERATCPDAAPRGLTDPDACTKDAGAPHVVRPNFAHVGKPAKLTLRRPPAGA